jgi:hypothetical protein
MVRGVEGGGLAEMSFKPGDLVQIVNTENREYDGLVGVILNGPGQFTIDNGIRHPNALTQIEIVTGYVNGFLVEIAEKGLVAVNPLYLRPIYPPDSSKTLTTWDSDPLLRQIRYPSALTQIEVVKRRIEREKT